MPFCVGEPRDPHQPMYLCTERMFISMRLLSRHSAGEFLGWSLGSSRLHCEAGIDVLARELVATAAHCCEEPIDFFRIWSRSGRRSRGQRSNLEVGGVKSKSIADVIEGKSSFEPEPGKLRF